MDFAVVKIAGKQHLVKVGDTISVEAPLGEVGKSLTFPEVLLLSSGDKISVGTPLVGGAVVKAEVVSSGKGEKIQVAKFKAKARYRRVMGFRPLLTVLRITNIEANLAQDNKKKSPKLAK